MATSPITNLTNHLSETALFGAFMAGVGYLFGRVVTSAQSNLQVSPEVGLVCGATAGIILSLFNAKGANSSSKTIGFLGLIFIPFRICQKLELPVTFKAVTITTTSIVAISIISFITVNTLIKD